jgi:hypothetical protein
MERNLEKGASIIHGLSARALRTCPPANSFQSIGRRISMKPVLTLSAAALALALTAAPATAANDPTKLGCTKMVNGQCTAWNQLTPDQARHVRMHDVFGPNYPYYIRLADISEDVVRQYDLEPRSLYIGTSEGYLFVIDPNGYWVTRVIPPIVNDR